MTQESTEYKGFAHTERYTWYLSPYFVKLKNYIDEAIGMRGNSSSHVHDLSNVMSLPV